MLIEVQAVVDGSNVRQKGEEQTSGVCEVQTGDEGEGKTNVLQTNKG